MLRKPNNEVSMFCVKQNIQWRFTPEHAPHFGGLWEAAVKSFKTHLKKMIGEAKLNFKELTTTTLVQIEECLNSWPLTTLPKASDELEVLTPGHHLVGRPLPTLPDHQTTQEPTSLLKCWSLCQRLVHHFWEQWFISGTLRHVILEWAISFA